MNFWKEFQRLILDYPVPEYFGHANEKSFGDYMHNCENCYMAFDSSKCTDGAYLYTDENCNSCVDLDFSNICENCYMSVSSGKCNNCSYVFDSGNLTNCDYCLNCGNCQDCFGCVDIGNKQYCFFNRQMTKEEYFGVVEEYKSNREPEQILEDLRKHAERFPVTATSGTRRTDSNTDYTDSVYRSQNVYMSFEITDSQNILYSNQSHYCVDCCDLSYCYKCENCYNCVDTGHSHTCVACYFSNRLLNCMYNYYCNNCQDCIGCVGLYDKKFCVLNRQVTEERFNEIKELVAKNPNVEIEL